MSSMQPNASKFDSVDSIVTYLRESSSPEVVSSTTTSSVVDSTKINNQLKSKKKQKKEKQLANLMNIRETNSEDIIQQLPSGRVRYGPITVNPRRQASKTLFTGRRSKYEVLDGEEAEKRRLRRERNRLAATKCREKRENILNDLDIKYGNEKNIFTQLTKTIQQLEQRKQQLQSMLSHQPLQQINSTTQQQQSSMVFGDTNFLSSIIETSTQPLPPPQLEFIANNEEEFHRFLQPSSLLTNSSYNTDQSNYLFNSQQQQPPSITMTTSSLDRMINSLCSPTPCIDTNNNNCSGLFNSAYGTSTTCAQQHSSSSEDDSLPPTHKNSFVF